MGLMPDGAGLQPFLNLGKISLGRCPRLVWPAPLALDFGQSTAVGRPLETRPYLVASTGRLSKPIRTEKGHYESTGRDSGAKRVNSWSSD